VSSGDGPVTAGNKGPLLVGFVATKCSNCSAIGTAYTAPTYSDQQLEQAVVKGINSRGGIAGRQVQAVYATVDTASASWGTDYQAACSTFTQDNHVVAVFGYSFAYEENLASCLSKAGVLWINGGYAGGDLETFAKYRYYFTDVAPTEDAELILSVNSALEDGVISPKSRLGILQVSCPQDVRSFNNSLMPYLTAHHLNLVSNQTSSCVSGAQDDGSYVAFVQHAQLQMRTDGVDSVIIAGIPLIVFAENAESQHWYPHYVAFGGGAPYEPYLPADQLANIHGAGWLPTLDVDTGQQPPLTAAQSDCLDLLRRGGVDVPIGQRNFAFIACDGIRMYAQAVAKIGGDSAPPHVTSSLESLGNSYQSAVTVDSGSNLTATRHASPSGFRSNVYKTACNCFQYVGPVRPIPQSG